MKKLTEQECLDVGGHSWVYYSCGDVDEIGVRYYPTDNPRCRICKHCGIEEELVKAIKR